MKLSRKHLRQLILKTINETRIKPNIPGLDTDSYGKAQALARHSDPAVRQQADHLASAMGYEGSFSGDIGDYDNPVTRETVVVVNKDAVAQGTEKSSREKEIVIPRYLVDAVVNAHQVVEEFDAQGGSETDFIEAAQEIFSHIERDVQPDYVYAYGLRVIGYRAKEYQDAMNAVGEYL